MRTTDLLQEIKPYVLGWIKASGAESGAASSPYADYDVRYWRSNRIVRMGETWATYEKSAAGLTAALAAISPGDTVWCPPGTYAGSFTVQAGATLRGASRDGVQIVGTLTVAGGGTVELLTVSYTSETDDDIYAVIPSGVDEILLRDIKVVCRNPGRGIGYAIKAASGTTTRAEYCDFRESDETVYTEVSIPEGTYCKAHVYSDGAFTWIDPIPPGQWATAMSPGALDCWVVLHFYWPSSGGSAAIVFEMGYEHNGASTNEAFYSDAGVKIETNSGASVTQTITIAGQDSNIGAFYLYTPPNGAEVLWFLLAEGLTHPASATGRGLATAVAIFDGLNSSKIPSVTLRSKDSLYYAPGSGTVSIRWYPVSGILHLHCCYTTDEPPEYHVPSWSDRSAWDIVAYPERHAKDIADGAGIYHWTMAELSAAYAALLHAAQHQHGGADEVATATPAANAIPKADASGDLDAWISAASDAVPGLAEFATTAETQTGTAADRAVTPAGLRADVPTTPTASRGVRLDDNGDLLLPVGGDVLPDGATDVDHGIDKRLRDVSGPVGVGDYGYNPIQIQEPSTAWYLGDLTNGRDDFFIDNVSPAGTAQWSYANAGTGPTLCSPANSLFTNRVSWWYLVSTNSGGATPRHAIAVESLSTTDRIYRCRMDISISLSNARIGYVIMSSDLKTGMAWWMWGDATNKVQNLIFATYSSANAWLSQANAEKSNVAYTTDWTVRWTSANIPAGLLRPQILSLRPAGLSGAAYIFDDLRVSTEILRGVGGHTPAYLFLFVEGNLPYNVIGYFDNITY
jgi:hypothetical protein